MRHYIIVDVSDDDEEDDDDDNVDQWPWKIWKSGMVDARQRGVTPVNFLEL